RHFENFQTGVLKTSELQSAAIRNIFTNFEENRTIFSTHVTTRILVTQVKGNGNRLTLRTV
ncbi:hypothetical protein, partial [Streptomyces narbonensis]|uniref:hypothetical protein n=1 Tax=Streptomyces narbonensis TaxID=67333 RepID=UPI001E496B3B